MLLGLKHVDLTSSKQYQNKPRQKLPHIQKSAFDLLKRRYGNGNAAGATFVGMERRYVLNVLTGFIQLMRKRLYRLLCAKNGRSAVHFLALNCVLLTSHEFFSGTIRH